MQVHRQARSSVGGAIEVEAAAESGVEDLPHGGVCLQAVARTHKCAAHRVAERREHALDLPVHRVEEVGAAEPRALGAQHERRCSADRLAPNELQREEW